MLDPAHGDRSVSHPRPGVLHLHGRQLGFEFLHRPRHPLGDRDVRRLAASGASGGRGRGEGPAEGRRSGPVRGVCGPLCGDRGLHPLLRARDDGQVPGRAGRG